MDYIPFMREPTVLEKVFSFLNYPIDVVSRPFAALLSIPALSFFVIPAFGSYSTTINFLFFYLTWAVLIKSNNPLSIEILGALGIRLIFYLLPSLGFLLFDSASPSLAVGIKEHGRQALPMGPAYGGPKGRWWKIALVSTLNVLLGATIQILVSLLFTKVLRVGSALKISTTPPFPWTIIIDVLLGLTLREILTYVLHRYVVHSPRTGLSKLHKSWQHSIGAPFSLVAHYDHPLPYLVHVFLPMHLAALILRMHLLTYNIYLILVSLEETFAYSGYNVLPSGFILGGIARRQERHLMGGGTGNFGAFGLVDFFMGTSLGGDLVDDVMDEAEKKDLPRKARGKARSLTKKAQKEIEPAADEDEDAESEEEEATPPPKPSRRAKKGSSSGAKSQEASSGEASGGLTEKLKGSFRSRKSKKSSDEGEDGVLVDGGEEKPKRKSSVRKAKA